MVSFPNCKINLGLRILHKRPDGFHDLETVFFPLPFYDVLEIVPAAGQQFSFTTTGLSIEGDQQDNLCIKAYELLKKDFPGLPAVQMHLHKHIPTGAGLGGGSADAAFTLQLLNKRFQLGLSTSQLLNYALHLGSDGPFFIINTACLAASRGEELTPVAVDLSPYHIVLVNPGIHVHTGKAFAGITPAIPPKSLQEIIRQPVSTWKNELVNDFETTVFVQHPAIASIKKTLYAQGAIYASMSGSGSSVYGIFEKNNTPAFSLPGNYLVKRLACQLQ